MNRKLFFFVQQTFKKCCFLTSAQNTVPKIIISPSTQRLIKIAAKLKRTKYCYKDFFVTLFFSFVTPEGHLYTASKPNELTVLLFLLKTNTSNLLKKIILLIKIFIKDYFGSRTYSYCFHSLPPRKIILLSVKYYLETFIYSSPRIMNQRE